MRAEQTQRTSAGDVFQYIVILVGTVIAVFAFIAVVYRYNDAYEASAPRNIMEAYMEQRLPRDLSEAITAYSEENATDYQTAEEIAWALTEGLPADQWYYQPSDGYTDRRPVYTLYCDHMPLGTVVLELGDKDLSNFNMDSWETSSSLFHFEPLCRTVTITAPYGCTVYVNGAELSEDYVSETAGLYPQLLDYELEIPKANQLMIYVLDDIVTDIAVELENGYTLLWGEQEDGAYYALPTCKASLADTLMEMSDRFIRAHVDFTLNKVSLWGVQQYTVTDGTLYNSLTQAAVGLDWGWGIGAEITKLEVKDFIYYGNAATCRVVYKMDTKEGQRAASSQLLLVDTSEGWRVAVIEENS